jgi:hypothetical protein
MSRIQGSSLFAFTFALALASASIALCQTPLGGEFQINQRTELNQGDQQLAAASDGSFAVVWSDLWNLGGIGYSSFVTARFYDSQGRPYGDEVHPGGLPGNGNVGGFAFVVPRPSTGFRLLWTGISGINRDLRLRSYSTSGVPLGGQINRPFFDPQMAITSVLGAPSGRMSLSWLASQSLGKMASIDPRGKLVGPVVNVAEAPEGSFLGALALGMDATGKEIAVWSGDCGNGGNTKATCDIFAQSYSRTGERLWGPTLVNSFRKGAQDGARVAVAADGHFLVVWQTKEPNTPDNPFAYDVAAQFFSPSGAKIGPELRLGHLPNFSDIFPEVAADPAGNFVAVWSTFRLENEIYGWDIYGQLFRNDGNRFGKPFRINTHQTATEFSQPKVAFGGNGTFVVIWNASDGDFDGVFGQRFSSPFGQ